MYLVRHGQTVFNLERRHQGYIDSPLTELGREQARRAGIALAALLDPPDTVVFSSPLGRAFQTAKIVAEAVAIERPIIVDPDLMEIGMGSCEGITEAEMAKRWPESKIPSTGEGMSFLSPDGETLEALAERLSRALRRIGNHGAPSRIVVSHGISSRVMRALYLGLNLTDAFGLDAPQDALFLLTGGDIARIPF